jgi:CheY-like chemotaxis protein
VETDLADVGSWAAVQQCVRADGTAAPFHLFATPRVDPATKEPLGCYLSGSAMIAHSRQAAQGGSLTPPSAPKVHNTLPKVDPNALPSVLVIEDDEQMRGLVRRYLERAGYGVVEATSGRDGMRILRDGAAVHFIVTDLKMADGSGGWLMAQVGYEFPVLLPRTIVISGEADGAAAAHVAVRWKCPVLAKPFDAAVLLSTLSRLAAAA